MPYDAYVLSPDQLVQFGYGILPYDSPSAYNTPPADGTIAPTILPAPTGNANQDAANTQAAVQNYRGVSYLLRTQPGYDYGTGSKKRNRYYADAGLGDNMSRLLMLDRPTMGFDIWGALVQGAQAGVNKYNADPNKPAGPSLPSLNVPGVPSISLPAWLTKPISTVGGSIINSVTAAKKADDAKARAQAAANGSTMTSVRPTASASSISPLWITLGAIVVGIAVVKAVKR